MKYFAAIFCFIILFGITAESQTSNVKIKSYNIKTSYYKTSNELNVKLIFNFHLKHTDSILFLFNHQCKINSVKLIKGEKWNNVKYIFKGRDSLFVDLNKIDIKNKNQKLKFDYSFPAGKYNDTVFITGRGDRWYPLIMDQVAKFKLTCKVSKGMQVLASGNLTEDKTEGDTSLFVWKSKMPVFKIPLIIFNPLRYKETSFDSSGTNINFYYTGNDSAGILNILDKASSAMNYFEALLGKYPFKKLTFFEVSDFPGTDIGTGLLMMGTQTLESIKKGYAEGFLLPVAEQWLGAGVFAKYGQPGFFFLNISLPHYLRLMYVRHSQGEKVFEESLMKPLEGYKEFAGTDKDIPIIDVDFPNTKEKGRILYAKGPYILSKVEAALGSTIWQEFIRNLYKSYHGKILTLNRFKKMLSHYDKTGKVLADFNKMINEKGLPE